MDERTYVYSNYNDVPAQEEGYAYGTNQHANWRYIVETTTVERVRVPASGYANFNGERNKNELYRPAYAPNNYHAGGYHEMNYGPVYERSSPPNLHEHEDVMNNFLKKLQIEASRPTKPSNISGPNRFITIPNNNWPKSQPHRYPSQDTHMTQNFPGPNKYRPSSPTKYRPSSPTKYRPSSPIKYQPSSLTRYPLSGPNKYPSSPPKYQPSSPTKYRPSSPTKYHPSSHIKYQPSSPNKYQPSSPNKYRSSDLTRYQPSGPNNYPSSPPKYRPSSPNRYRPSSPNKYRPSSPNKYRPSSPTKYGASSYRSYSPTRYQSLSPTNYQPSIPNKYSQISPTKYRHTSPTKYQQTSPNTYQPTSPTQNYPHRNGNQNIQDPNMFRSTSPIDSFPSKGPPLDTQSLTKHQPSSENGKKDGAGDFLQSIGLPTTRHHVTPPTNNDDKAAVSYLAESGNHSPRSEPNRGGEFDNLSPHAQPVQPEIPNTKPTFGSRITRCLFRSNTIDSQEAIKKYGGASVP